MTDGKTAADNETAAFGQLELGDVQGSVLQRAWAKRIRARILTALLGCIAETKRASELWIRGCTDKDSAVSVNFMQPAVEREETVLRFLCRVESSDFWIDHRSLSIKNYQSRKNGATDFIKLAEKLIADARQTDRELNGYDRDALEKYCGGTDYRAWFERHDFFREPKTESTKEQI